MNHRLYVVIPALGFTLMSCEGGKAEREPRISPADVKRDAQKAFETTKTYVTQQAGELRKQLSAKLTEMKPLIAATKARAKAATGDARAELDRLSDDLDHKLSDAQEKLGDLDQAGADASDEVKAKARKALDEANEAYEKLKKRLDGA